MLYSYGVGQSRKYTRDAHYYSSSYCCSGYYGSPPYCRGKHYNNAV